MPEIKEYTAPNARDVVKPPEGGAEAYRSAGSEAIRLAGQTHEIISQEAERLQRGFSETGAALREAQTIQDRATEHQGWAELGNLSTQFTGAQNQFLQNYVAQRSQHQNDPEWQKEVADQALELVQPYVQQATDPRARLRLQELGNDFARSMSLRIASDTGAFASAAVHQNMITTVNNATGMIAADPTYGTVDHALSIIQAQHDHTANFPGAKPEDVAFANTEQLHATAHAVGTAVNSILYPSQNTAYAQMSPQQRSQLAQQMIDRYRSQISGEDASKLTEAVTHVTTAGLKDQHEQAVWQVDDANKAVKALAGRIETSMITVGPDGQQTLAPPPADLRVNALARLGEIRARYPGIQFDESPITRAIQVMDKRTEELASGKAVIDDKATVAGLLGRLYKDPNDPQAVTEQELFNLRMGANPKLSDTSYLRFVSQVKDNEKADQSTRLGNKVVDDAMSTARAMLTSPDPWSAAYQAGQTQVNIKGQQAWALYAPWFTEQFAYLTRVKGMSAGEASAQLTDPKVLAKFAWNAGESGQFIQNLLPVPPPAAPSGMSWGGTALHFWHNFVGHLWAPDENTPAPPPAANPALGPAGEKTPTGSEGAAPPPAPVTPQAPPGWAQSAPPGTVPGMEQ